MPLFSNTTILRIIDATAIVLSQSLQLARARLASATSPVLRMMVERDHIHNELGLLRREVTTSRSVVSPRDKPGGRYGGTGGTEPLMMKRAPAPWSMLGHVLGSGLA